MATISDLAAPPAVDRAAGPALLSPPTESVRRQPRPDPQDRPANGRRIRVLLADDYPIVREGLARLLQMQPDIEVVGQAADGLEAVHLALELGPDVVVMDVSMPGLSGIEATQCIHKQQPRIRIIGLSMYNEPQIAEAMSRAGAVRYLTKTTPPIAIVSAIRGDPISA